jgi:hypothetical protein
VEYDETTKEKKETGTHDKIGVNQVPTQADGAIWEESNETVWNEISKSTTTQPTNSNNGQIPKTKSYSPEIGLNTFVKNESLNILNDNEYMFFHGLDENRNIKDGELDIMYDPKENESLLIKVDIENTFPKNTSWSNVFNTLNTTTINSKNNFTGEAKLYYDIFIKNYINLIKKYFIIISNDLNIEFVQFIIQSNNPYLFLDFGFMDDTFSVKSSGNLLNHKI